MTLSDRVRIFCFAIIIGQAAANAANGQIATDGTVGPGIELSGTDVFIGDDLGTRAGDNLFHSFDQFNIETGQSVTFTGPGDLDNVVNRVTGSDPSDINGALRSEVGTADFWLINPNGVTFGPGAALDVPGSFHVSTADEIVFSDGASYSASLPDQSGLSVAAPEAFGFFDRDPASISIRNAAIGVEDGETISLVGGDISIEADFDLVDEDGIVLGVNPAVTTQNGGSINLTAVASSGQVDVATGETTASGLGNIDVGQVGSIRVSGAGEIKVRGKALRVFGIGSFIGAVANDDPSGTSLVDIEVNELIVSEGQIRTVTRNDINGAAEIVITAGNVRVVNGGDIISTSSAGNADGGQITITAIDVRVEDVVEGDRSRISTDAQGTPGSPAFIPPISVIARLREPLPFETAAAPPLPPTPVRPVARPVAPLPPSAPPTGGGDLPPPPNDLFQGDAGVVAIIADTIVVTEDGLVTSSSTSGGDGGQVLMSGSHLLVSDSGAVTADAQNNGNAGLIAIEVDGTVTVEDDGTLSTTAANSSGGLIDIRADEYVLFRDTEVSTTISDTGGDIEVETGILILDDSRVDLDAQGDRPTFRSLTAEFLKSAESEIEINSTLVEPETTDLADELALLEAELADPSDLLRETCEDGGDLANGTFVASGAGMPIGQDGLLPGFYGFSGHAAKSFADDEGEMRLAFSTPCTR